MTWQTNEQMKEDFRFDDDMINNAYVHFSGCICFFSIFLGRTVCFDFVDYFCPGYYKKRQAFRSAISDSFIV